MLRLALALLLSVPCAAQAAPTPVTVWTERADALGDGNANWHSLAIMHMAMHDAVNAARPVFARWAPAAPGEVADGALPEAALEAAAALVLVALHPAQQAETEALLADRLALLPPGPAREAGRTLGARVAAEAVRRRAGDGFERARAFPGSDVPGRWRPVPPRLATSGVTETRPFLFESTGAAGGLPPPEPGGARYLADVAEVRRLGGGPIPQDRTAAQSEAAIYWAYQSTQRGFVHLAATIVEDQPRFADLAVQARAMSLVAVAMAESAILVWDAKAHWRYWRPVTAIQSGAFGVDADPSWQSFVETPPHPEYPSGHAADCFTGGAVLRALLGGDRPVVYTARSAAPGARVWTSDIGDPPAPGELVALDRPFPSLAAAAQECADARIWAGAHFRSANEESHAIAERIAERAMQAVPPLAR